MQQPENTADEVALRKEGVDRNNYGLFNLPVTCQVALRKEGVDRNALSGGHDCYSTQSLSARRAWIEIIHYTDRTL